MVGSLKIGVVPSKSLKLWIWSSLSFTCTWSYSVVNEFELVIEDPVILSRVGELRRWKSSLYSLLVVSIKPLHGKCLKNDFFLVI